jgi:uncharacterized protein YndB with AHSA1/START domain
MATIERLMAVTPAAVWDALADPDGYGYWVVGSKEVRDADAGWPEPGSRFHHTVGFGPLEIKDHTVALASERPRLLRMRAKARPLGTATVTLELKPEGTGTRVRMTETPDGVVATLLAGNPVADRLIAARNRASLQRLEELARTRADGTRAGTGTAAA